MGTVTLALPSDGTTGEAADVNTPLTTLANEINGNLDNSNIKSGAAIATSKLADDAGISTAKIADTAVTPAKLLAGAGTSWDLQTQSTPTLTNMTLGNGTITARYTQVGKMVKGEFHFTLGSTSAVSGDGIFALPKTAIALVGTSNLIPIGRVSFFDTSASVIVVGYVFLASTTTAVMRPIKSDTTYAGIGVLSGTVPFGAAFATGDEIHAVYEYPIA